MFNVAVVNIKEILKYLVSITITLCLLMLVTRYFSSLSKDEICQLEIMQKSLLVCLDETIPGIKETNRELNNTDEEQIKQNEILGEILKIELAMFKQEQKIAEIQNATSNQVENIEGNKQEEEKSPALETGRRRSHTSSNTKSFIR